LGGDQAQNTCNGRILSTGKGVIVRRKRSWLWGCEAWHIQRERILAREIDH
jgi:hypothetical protein